jgi:protein-arginine kinase activator protein McsA
MEMASIEMDDNSIQKPGRDTTENERVNPKEVNPYSKLSLDELENLLDDAIRNEDYLKAAQIRDEIDKRN